jgi:hypothetical protein
MKSGLPDSGVLPPVPQTKFARIRLGLAALLFAAWMGWLLYLVLMTAGTRPVVLSRPQFLVSSLDVVARVDRVDGENSDVNIIEVLWPTERAKRYEGQTIKVANLVEAQADWTGPGEYILPLLQRAEDAFEVTPTPRSPGYSQGGRPRIYPLTEETRKQYQSLRKPEALNKSL